MWHWRDLRPQAMRAAQLVGTEQAERRVLRLHNPELAGSSASNTLVANIQIVMPGEIARAHRHSPSALRLIIEGKGGYTVVNGARIPMSPGDLVLTPKWTWHDHANDTDAPMIWLDGLDTPLVRMLEAGFYEQYDGEAQPIGTSADPTSAKYGAGGLRPAWEPAPAVPYSPLWHYPMSQVRAALEQLAAEENGSPFDGVILEYTNPLTRWTSHADHGVLHAVVASRRAHPGAPPRLLHELPRHRGLWLLAGRRPTAGVGGQGRVHGTDVDFPRARQHW